MWEDFIHHIYDIYYVVMWLVDNLKELFSVILEPLTWILNYGRGFLLGLQSTPEEIDFVFPEAVGSFIAAIPYIDYLFTGVGIVLGILFLSWLLNKIIHI